MEQVAVRGLAPSRSQWIALLCLAYALFAALAFPSTFLAVLNQYPIQRYYVVIPPLALCGLLAAAFLHRPRSPLGFLRDKLADRGIGAVLTIAVFIVAATGFTALKHEYSFLVPFYADAALADLDRLIHFGDPWRWARAIVPAAADRALYMLYSQLWFVELVATVLYAAFAASRADRERYFSALAFSAIFLSSAVRVAGSSAGPVFYDRLNGGNQFGDLIAALQTSPAGPDMLALANYLYESYATQTTVLGTGISAMPSLHVALATLNALFIASRSRLAGCFAWTYAAIIMFGSVYFGWHYAVDGYVSIIAVLVFWRLAGQQNPTKTATQ